MSGQVIKVRDVMTAGLKTIDGLASVRDAIELMRTASTSSLVITKRHDGDEYGVVTVHDIAEKIISQNRSIDRSSVYEVMSKPALTVNADMNIKYAIRLLVRLGEKRALVADNNSVVGFVSQRDMVVRYAGNEESG
ncbi:MAG: CBS domain-containing protein [Filomicrobium sp.]